MFQADVQIENAKEKGGETVVSPPFFQWLGKQASDYFMFVVTLLNVVDSLPPRVVIAETAATAMRAAIRPYSMAVAPLEFLTNLRMNDIMVSKSLDFTYPATSVISEATLRDLRARGFQLLNAGSIFFEAGATGDA